MKPDTDNQELSELELAIQNRQRKIFECEIPDVLGHSGKPLGKVLLRIPTVAEQEQALLEANKYIENKAKDSKASEDADFVENIKTAHILHKVCLKKRGEGFKPVAAFQSPSWMLENMGALELGAILDHFNDIVRVTSNVKSQLNPDMLRTFAKYCSNNIGSKEPNEFLAKLDYNQIGEALILMAIMYDQADIAHKSLLNKKE